MSEGGDTPKPKAESADEAEKTQRRLVALVRPPPEILHDHVALMAWAEQFVAASKATVANHKE